MGRRRTKIDDEAVGLLIVIAAVALVGAIVIPITWFVFEVRRFGVAKGKEAFEPTWNEKRNRENAMQSIQAAERQISEAHTDARNQDCMRRADGLYDERKVVAREINYQIREAIDRKDNALQAKSEAEDGPLERWKKWAYIEGYCWTGRIGAAAFLISLCIPWDAYTSLTWNQNGFAKFLIHFYTSAVPVGLLAYFGAGFWTKRLKPQL